MNTAHEFAAISSLALTLALPVALAEPPPGRLLASQCAQCHGTDGRAVAGFESLSGESELGDLLEFKRSNSNNIMVFQAKGYTDAQLRLISDWFASTSGGESGDD